MPNEASQANEGPFDKRVYPPKWAFDPISDEEYERQKAEYEAVSTTDTTLSQLDSNFTT
jgi:hypothetical protein